MGDLPRVRTAISGEEGGRVTTPETTGTDWVTTDDVARVLRVHPSTITRLVHNEGLPHIRLGANGSFRFRLAEVEQWLRDRGGAA